MKLDKPKKIVLGALSILIIWATIIIIPKIINTIKTIKQKPSPLYDEDKLAEIGFSLVKIYLTLRHH